MKIESIGYHGCHLMKRGNHRKLGFATITIEVELICNILLEYKVLQRFLKTNINNKLDGTEDNLQHNDQNVTTDISASLQDDRMEH